MLTVQCAEVPVQVFGHWLVRNQVCVPAPLWATTSVRSVPSAEEIANMPTGYSRATGWESAAAAELPGASRLTREVFEVLARVCERPEVVVFSTSGSVGNTDDEAAVGISSGAESVIVVDDGDRVRVGVPPRADIARLVATLGPRVQPANVTAVETTPTKFQDVALALNGGHSTRAVRAALTRAGLPAAYEPVLRSINERLTRVGVVGVLLEGEESVLSPVSASWQAGDLGAVLCRITQRGTLTMEPASVDAIQRAASASLRSAQSLTLTRGEFVGS